MKGMHPLKVNVDSDEDVRNIINYFKDHVWPKLQLWEFFLIDVDDAVEEFHHAVQNHTPFHMKYGEAALEDTQIDPVEILLKEGVSNDGTGQRWSSFIDLETALALFNSPKCEHHHVQERCRRYREAVETVNRRLNQRVQEDFEAIQFNLFYRICRGTISLSRPLVEPYFTKVKLAGFLLLLFCSQL